MNGTGATGTVRVNGMWPVIVPKSPKIKSSAEPTAVIVSPPASPMTTCEPPPVSVIVSAAPSVGSVAVIAAISTPGTQSTRPLSPRTMS